MIAKAAKIEGLLVAIGANVKDEGFGKKYSSVKHKLPLKINSDIEMIIRVRNELAHTEIVYLTDAKVEIYLKKTKSVQAELMRLIDTKELISSQLVTLRTDFSKSRGVKKWAIGVTIAALAIGGAAVTLRLKK